MQFNFRDSDYRIKYKARGIAWRGKIGVDVSDCKTYRLRQAVIMQPSM